MRALRLILPRNRWELLLLLFSVTLYVAYRVGVVLAVRASDAFGRACNRIPVATLR